VVSIETATDPNALTHYNQLNAATSRRCDARRDRRQAVDFLEGEARKLPAGFSHDYLSDPGNTSRKATSSRSLRFALIIIFLVLAAQFESLRDPL